MVLDHLWVTQLIYVLSACKPTQHCLQVREEIILVFSTLSKQSLRTKVWLLFGLVQFLLWVEPYHLTSLWWSPMKRLRSVLLQRLEGQAPHYTFKDLHPCAQHSAPHSSLCHLTTSRPKCKSKNPMLKAFFLIPACQTVLRSHLLEKVWLDSGLVSLPTTSVLVLTQSLYSCQVSCSESCWLEANDLIKCNKIIDG